MGWFKKKPDPLSERARALTEKIAALEAQIKHLDSKPNPVPTGPRVRSTALPHGAVPAAAPSAPPAPPPAGAVEPIFEEVDHKRLQAEGDSGSLPEHFNELGVRKYDLAALWRRLHNHFQGPSTANPKLVNYLAAGSLHGLRPMRYEKRVARNRFLFLVAFLLLVLLGIAAKLLRW